MIDERCELWRASRLITEQTRTRTCGQALNIGELNIIVFFTSLLDPKFSFVCHQYIPQYWARFFIKESFKPNAHRCSQYGWDNKHVFQRKRFHSVLYDEIRIN